MRSDIAIPSLLTLPAGLVGLPRTHTLEVTPIAGGAFVELEDRDERGLGWLAVSAEDVRSGYSQALVAGGLLEPDEVVLVLLASHGDQTITANLAGPLAVGPDGQTRQLVLESPEYGVREPVARLTPSAGKG
jgi:flagellar assembly factor FliW